MTGCNPDFQRDDLDHACITEARLEDVLAGRDATHRLSELLEEFAE